MVAGASSRLRTGYGHHAKGLHCWLFVTPGVISHPQGRTTIKLAVPARERDWSRRKCRNLVEHCVGHIGWIGHIGHFYQKTGRAADVRVPASATLNVGAAAHW